MRAEASPALWKWGFLGDDVTDETAEKSLYIIVIAFINLVSEKNRKTTTDLFLVTMVTWALWSLLLYLNLPPPPLPPQYFLIGFWRITKFVLERSVCVCVWGGGLYPQSTHGDAPVWEILKVWTFWLFYICKACMY